VNAAAAQTGTGSPQERDFPQSKAVVEQALKKAGVTSGRLPTLDGFAVPDARPLERFQRGYYQMSVIATQSGSGTRVTVGAKITAWYADPAAAKSGYQTLPSNGRLESDFLDQLQDALGANASTKPAGKTIAAAPTSTATKGSVPELSAPVPRLPSLSSPLNGSTLSSPSAAPPSSSVPVQQQMVLDRHLNDLRQQAKNLTEILQNQSHPANLVAVKTEGAPILASPTEGAKVVFTANAQDEFEVLDSNSDWVHVRIVGLSRGWIRKSNLEIADQGGDAGSGETFHVSKQEVRSFPGDWDPLRGKPVKIVSVQTATDTTTSAKAKVAYARGVFDSQTSGLAADPDSPAGVVIVFDTQDGGMIAATEANLEKWKAGSLSDDAFWRSCFFDPPEISGTPVNR
jgi:hypothetical protein